MSNKIRKGILEILISTYGDGITRIPKLILPYQANISYLIVWQCAVTNDINIESLNKRKDVKIIRSKTIGLSKSRNIALLNATGEFLLIADDDNIYKKEFFVNIFQAFNDNKTIDILTFQAICQDHSFLHQYAEDSFSYPNIPPKIYFNSNEIAIRNSAKIVKFNEYLGLNADVLCCGEEEVFLYDCYCKGLKIKYIPKVIVITNRLTTGTKFKSDKSVRMSKGAVLYLLHGTFFSLLKVIKQTFLISKINFHTRISFFYDMVEGIIYMRNIKNGK